MRKMKTATFVLISNTFIVAISQANYSVFEVLFKYMERKKVGAVNLFDCRYEGLLTVLKRTSPFLIKGQLTLEDEQVPNLLRAQHYVTGIILMLDCPRSTEILNAVSELRLLNSSFAYALVSKVVEIEKTLRELESLRIALDSDVALFTSSEIFEIHRIADDRALVSASIGRWEGEELHLTPVPPRWDLNGTIITAVTVIKEFDPKAVGSDEFFDFNYHPIVDTLSRHMCSMNRYVEIMNNFRTNLSASPDWGYLNETTGKFDKLSMYSMLEREEVELGLTASWIYAARAMVARFSPSFHLFASSIVFRHPPAGASLGALAKPLSLGTWLVLFTYAVVQIFCLHSIRRTKRSDEPRNEREFSSSILEVIGVLCLQGSNIESAKIPTRILSISIQVMALMAYSYYGATIVTFLLLPTPRTITSVDKLLDTNMDMWVENASLHKQHFKGIVAASATKFYEVAIRKQNKFVDRTIGLRLVQKGGAAIYGVTTSIHESVRNMFTSSEICSLQYLDVVHLQSAYAIRKRSPYVEVFLRSLLKLQEVGFADFEDRKWHAQRPLCVGAETNSAVKLEATFIAQMIFTIGFLFSMTIFAFELISRPRIRGKINKALIDGRIARK